MISALFRRSLVITLFTIASVIGVSLPSNSASISDLIPGGLATPGYYGVTFEERQPGLGELVSVITSNLAPQERVNGVGGTYLCASMDDPECSKGSGVSARLMLPPCSNADQRMCIEGLSLASGQGPMETATVDHEVWAKSLECANSCQQSWQKNLWRFSSSDVFSVSRKNWKCR